MLVQVTSPLTTAKDFGTALQQFVDGGYDSMVTGVPQHRFFWTADGRPLNYDPLHRPMRQEWAGSIVENGAFYLTKPEVLRLTGSRLGGHVGVYQMSYQHLIEIDEPKDWHVVEALLRQRAAEERRTSTY